MAEQKKNWFKRHKILTGILVLIVLGIIINLAGGGNSSTQISSNSQNQDSEATKPQEELSKKEEPVKKEELASIGTAVRDGKFEFVVKSLECGKTSVGTNQYLTKAPQGQFCLLNLTVKNIGNEAQSLLSSNQYLFNDAGQKYSADDTATMYNSPNGSSWYNDINPGNSVEGAIVFDVPKDVVPTVAQLHDSAFSSGIKVNLK